VGKCSRVAGVLAVGNALLLVLGLGLPSRVTAQTPGQGQTLAILLLLGLGPRPGALQAIQGQKPAPASVGAGTDRRALDKAAKKPQRAEGGPGRVTYDEVNGRKVARPVESARPPAEGKMSAALPLAAAPIR
jgi:hypothetical protein